jgi:type II secretory pathway predicted ATPase ExeA
MTANLLGLRENPFAAGHDPRLFHLTPAREEAIARLRHALAGGEPFVLVTGEPGIGKTSVIHRALESEGASTAFITHPALSRNELVEEICIRFEVELPQASSMPQALARLERHLCQLRARGEKPVLVIDEAQDLSPELLEELRLISNLESEGRPLLQIVLAGLPEIEGRLAQARLAQFRQRIATHCRIAPLSADETEAYVHHRVAVAGGDGPERFPRETCLEIHRLARGVPRAINTIAGQAMLSASRESARAVTAAHAQASAADSWLRSVAEGGALPRDAPVAGRDTPAGNEPGVAKGRPAAAKAGRKSEDPDVKAWVSRFVDPTRPLRIGGRAQEGRETSRFRREWAMASGQAAPAGGAGEGPEPGRGKPPRRPAAPGRLPDTLRRANDFLRRQSRSRLGLKLLAAVVAGIGAFQLTRLSQRPDPGRPVPVAPTTAETAPPAPPTEAASTAAPAGSARRAAPSRPRAVAKAESAAPRAPRRRLGIEAGSYINPERARTESAVLAELTGLPVRVVENHEDGIAIYRVVLGSFGSRRRAARAADDLLGRGMLEQARVIVLPAPDSTAR